MFDEFAKVLVTVCPETRKLVVGISINADRSMTERILGFLKRLSAETLLLELYRICCAHLYFSFFMQRFYSASHNEEGYSTLTDVIGHLCFKHNLVTQMRSTSRQVGATRWVYMHAAAPWLKSALSFLSLIEMCKSLRHSGQPVGLFLTVNR